MSEKEKDEKERTLCCGCPYNPISQMIRNGGEEACPDAFKDVAVYCKKNQKAEE